MKIFQGDQYAIPFTVKRDDIVQTDNDVEKLEIIFAGIRKTYPGELVYKEGEWFFPLMQEESLELSEGGYDVSARPYYKDGTVSGWIKAGTITVTEIEGAEEL